MTVTEPVTGVKLNQTNIIIAADQKMTLKATVEPSSATNKNVTWSSSNTSVATVSSSGVVTGVQEGTANITVKTADGGKTATCKVTVEPAKISVTGVTLDKTELALGVGMESQLTATVTPTNATDQGITWTSSKENVAAVDENGNVIAMMSGRATITATTDDGGRTASCKVSVYPTLIPMSLPDGTVGEDYLSVLEADGISDPRWGIFGGELPEGLSLDRDTGEISGIPVTEGTFEFKVYVESDSMRSVETFSITIFEADEDDTDSSSVKVKSVKLDKSSATVAVGDTVTLKATINPSDASNKKVTWKSSDSKIATVDKAGKVKGIGKGTATITVTTADGKKTASCKVTVTESVKVKSVRLNKKKVSLKKGKTYKLKATINPADATNKDVTWKSSNKKVVKVCKNGKIKAVKKGTATITVTTKDGKKKATCKVTVK